MDIFGQLVQSATQTLTSSDVSENEIEHSYGSASQGQWICSRTAGEMQKTVLDSLVLKRARSEITPCHNPKRHHARRIQWKFRWKFVTIKVDGCSFGRRVERNFGSIDFTCMYDFSLWNLVRIRLIVFTCYCLPKLESSRVENIDLTYYFARLCFFDTACQTTSWVQQQSSQVSGVEDEQRTQWLRWMRNVPSPLFLDLTSHVHDLIIDNHHTSDDPWIPKEHLEFVDMSLDRYISRIACHVILLPSGSETAPLSLVESTGAHVYGKLLYGGVNRFRILNSGKTVRRVGEKRETISGGVISHPSWDLPTVFDKSVLMGGASTDMVLSSAALGWDPAVMLDLVSEEDLVANNSTDGFDTDSKSNHAYQSFEGKQRTDALSAHFQNRVGGLQPQIDAIIRRVLDGRSIYSNFDSDNNNSMIKKARLEAEELAALGLQPVRGLLLYGRPGTGKTLLVREIARSLGARPPKICAAPELLDRWVGGSERRVRELFREAEGELAMCRMVAGGDDSGAFLQSALHVIVIDEIDAVFRKRIDADNSDAITRNSVVNQLLAKLDGVHALPNVLMIGMTNRRELLDEALLRPGRLEVQVEVPLPAESGRREILQIHFGGLRNLAKKALRPLSVMRARGFVDLASDEYTGGFSGADIAGLVRNAGSIALSRARVDGSGIDGLLITLEDVMQALQEVKS
ncbi:hypothetical protein HJC23_012852 [Cyclotella cryptica]|uniref:Vesicle-fusing ATPase n=1 Tax=Cyclotella cryptica TaxID=29204 RepID=A0ABD3Q7L5_9STRA